MSNHIDRFNKNIERVNNLNELFRVAKNTRKRPTIKEADILRASVVFLHSALEDYIRGILIDLLPLGDKTVLNGISLVGMDGRAEKFHLGALKDYENDTVKFLIKASVKEHMLRVSFNDTTELSSWLRKIHIDLSGFHQFDNINKMIQRRHKIVHEADTNPTTGRGNHSVTSININTVCAWLEAVQNLVNVIEVQTTSPSQVLQAPE